VKGAISTAHNAFIIILQGFLEHKDKFVYLFGCCTIIGGMDNLYGDIKEP